MKTTMSSVPLLLESFPAPPTFIPSTPSTGHYPSSPTTNFSPPSSLSGHSGSSSNPPPSRPPSVPLPPIPRNSRDSDVSFAMLSPQSRTARPAFIRSRSETHYSSAGSARPDSVMSTASAWSIGKSYEGHALDIHREEEAYDGIHRDTDDDEPEVQLTRLRMSISPMPPSPEPGTQRGTKDTKERELLSAVSMNDLPPSSDVEDDVPPNKRISSDSIASVATSSSVVVLQSSLRRNKPKRISTGDVHRSSLLPNSASTTSLTSNSAISPQSLLGSWPNTPNTPFVYTQPPTPLTPAFTESEIDTSPALDDFPVSASPSGTQAPTDGASSSTFTSAATSNSPEVSVDPHALHRELRSARSRSRGHRERLGMIHPLTPDVDTPPLPSTPMSATSPSSEQAVHPPSNRPIKSEPVRKRSTSPDLTALLSETRSRTRSRTRTRKSGRSSGANTPLGGSASARNSHHSTGSGSVIESSRKRRFYLPSSTSMPTRSPGSFEGASTPSRRSGGDRSAASVTSSSLSRGRKTSQRYLDHNHDEEERRIRRLERELDGEGSGSGSENELDRGRDIRGFGFDGIERVEGERGKRGGDGRNTNRDTMDDIFGEYLGSEAGSEYGGHDHGEEDRGESGSGLGSEGEDSDSSLDLHTPLPGWRLGHPRIVNGKTNNRENGRKDTLGMRSKDKLKAWF
ncbi:hypothetical protein D9758_008182 [Tetrapyrgos nigripes]|uniref:Uncharacterized protein n=1 Tax=Tetrapyrgos nigripes TaxID=182062 RepID=A0A8H5LPR8_9AGAR|nr:hypothetical protein D9758_008182 [Tetrapyrgos nigripes]